MAKPQLRNKPIKKKANPLKSAKIEKLCCVSSSRTAARSAPAA